MIFSFTRSVTRSGFSPCRISTTPPTTSLPSFSNTPRRNPGPSWTVATVLTYTGVPFTSLTTASSISALPLIQPIPRTMYSALFFWITPPAAGRFERPTASNSSPTVTP